MVSSYESPLSLLNEFSAVLAAHDATHQALELRDIYKLIYQRVFGPEHSLSNRAAARERLYLEVLQLPATLPAKPLLEPLSPLLCRVNLHPFVQGGGSLRRLWDAFDQTARAFQPGTLAELQRTWSVFLTTPWAQRYAPELCAQFWQQMATADFSPVHHSSAYAKANAPHYRVVLRTLAVAHLGLTG